MATSPIPRPGVEVVQELRTTTPTQLTPTLPGLIAGPAYEVIELFVNGVLNTAKAKYSDADGNSYDNFRSLELFQTDFPGGHVTDPTGGLTNTKAGMVDVLEDEIRAFLVYSGVRKELSEFDTSDNSRVLKSFLIAHNVATRPFVRGSVDLVASGPLALDGLTLSVAVDAVGGSYPDYIPTSSDNLDTVIQFQATNPATPGVLAPDEVVSQINSYIPNLAHLVVIGSAKYLALVSPSWGANARVLVRDTGASQLLGFHSLGQGEVYSLGAGFRARDDGDNDFESPLVELYRGSTRALSSSILTGATIDDDNADLTASSSYDSAAHPIQDIDFTKSSGSNIRVGDEMVADGAVVGLLYAAQNKQLTMGTSNGALAVSNSEITRKELGLQTNSTSPFAPRYVYFNARNLSATAEAAATSAQATSNNAAGSVWNDPEPVQIDTAGGLTFPLAFGTGKLLKYTSTVNGVPQDERSHVISGTASSLTELVTALNTGSGLTSVTCAPPLSSVGELVASAQGVDKITLKSVSTGSSQFVLVGSGSANAVLDPAATPNLAAGEIYQGLDHYSLARSKGDGSVANVKDSALTQPVGGVVPAVTSPVNVEFAIKAIEDNGLETTYNLKANGTFSGGADYADAGLATVHNYARELNGEVQDSTSGEISIVSIVRDGVTDTSLTGQLFRHNQGLVKWHFQGPDEYVTMTSTGGSGALVAGEVCTQAVSLATGIVISDDAGGAGPGTFEIQVTSGRFDATNTITGATSGNTKTGAHTSIRAMAVSCRQEGRSNLVTLEDGAGSLAGSIGFTHMDEVRGTGIRPGAPLFFQIDQNPVFLAAVPQLQFVQHGTVEGKEVIFLDQIIEEMNDVSKQTIASIYNPITGGDDSKIQLTSNKVGEPSEVRIPPQVGDVGNPGYVEIWNSDSDISSAEMGLKFDETSALNTAVSDGKGVLARGNGRPLPDFAVMASDPAQIFLGSQAIRDPSTGAPLGDAQGSLYITYRGLRTDISAAQKNNGFLEPLEILDLNDLEDQLDPINDKNPLGLAMRIALSNLTNVPIKAIGVDEVDADNPDGTLPAWSRLLTYLEAHRVYAIAPITQDSRVHDLVFDHVTKMSEPSSRGERIAYINSPVPTRSASTLLNSGLDANSGTSNTALQLEESIIAGLQAAGATNISSIPVSADIYLELEGTSKRWNISSAAPSGLGTIITVRTTFGSSENTDLFYTTEALPAGLVNQDWAVYKRGSAITSADDVADAIVAQAQRFQSRRMNHLVADRAAINLTGTEDIISGAFSTAIYAAMSSQQNPQQGFTNFPVNGLTKIFGTNDTFSEAQMDLIAGGGNNILVQNLNGGAIFSRHQLTTDVTSTETEENSITRVLDFVSYDLRDSLRAFIGTFNITPTFLDQISTVIQGRLEALAASGVIISGELLNLVQDTSDPTTLLVDIILEVPFPANRIKLTIAI